MPLVQLYVYDLSNGLARQLSRQLTGRQIDGIWHTSVVVFGKEVFYGDGIAITPPGRSHHGSPQQIIDMGETSIDEATFDEYLSEIRDHYTADKYHLLDFNCNSFTNDCVGFLTGGSIPAWIKDLPSDFLSTPFGAALRPTIDSMFRRSAPGTAPSRIQAPAPDALQQAASASPDPALASALLQAVASQAYSSGSLSAPPLARTPVTDTSTVAAPIHICTNPSSLHGLLQSHRAAVVFFTSATCGPCRMIEPVFEELAHQKTHGTNGVQTAFVKIDMAVGMGSQVGSQWGVRVTPTFLFFLNNKKIHELKGVNAPELRTQVDLLLFQAFPPHPHTKLSLPAVEALSTNPILFTQVPALEAVSTKLTSFIDAATTSVELESAKKTISVGVLPYLKSRFPDKIASATAVKKPAVPASSQLLSSWASATKSLVGTLPPTQIFPLVDMWRMALLDEPVANWFASGPSLDPLQIFFDKSFEVLDDADPATALNGRTYVLTLLRMLANGFAHSSMTKVLLSTAPPGGKRAQVTRIVVTTLLHKDATVRTAAASLAFNVAATLQRSRVEKLRGATTGATSLNVVEDEEWEVELVSAVLEALSKEVQSEEVIHRLVAALAFLLRLSPSYYEGGLKSLLEVLQSRETVKSKLAKGGCGESGAQKAEVRKLIEEVAEKLLV